VFFPLILVCSLLAEGYTVQDMVSVILEVDDIKKSRVENCKLKGWEKLNLAMDSAGKSLRKLVRAKREEHPKPHTVPARSA